MDLMDPVKVQRILKIYRTAKFVGGVRAGYHKTKDALDAHREQSDILIDASDLAHRVIHKQVRPEDVRGGARAIVNNAPRIYRAVVSHIQKQKSKKEDV